ncbi:MAG: S41 family peptidase [Flavobacteriales bacterium]|nr:S41 family peptidase [Flavobacteriales bacterium]
MNNENLNKYEPAQTGNTDRKKPSAIQPLLFALTLIGGMFIGTNLGDKNLLQVKAATEENPNKLVSLIDFIEDNYVDSINKKELIEDAIQSVLQNLDPHSYYMKAEDMESEKEKMKGEFSGVGIEFLILRDSLMVVKTVAEGPASNAGLKSGDRIIKVENEEISGKELNGEKAQKLLKGKKGSDVHVTVLRPGEKSPLDFTITRGSIPLESVPSAFMINDSVGYIKVERFAETTYDEFREETEKLADKGCKKLMLDLRGNGGGLMNQAAQMVEEFLPEDRTIVMTKGVHTGEDVIRSSKKGKFRDMDVIVLIDQNSASASEIVAGALQDWDRSITVGRRSFGKGLVQHEMELADNSALRLTVARYYTPTGRCIQKPYGDSIDYTNDFHQRLVSGELTSADSIHFPDSLKYKTPGGRTVYGGGGITPDVFVPLDSIYFSGLLSEIAYSGLIRDYCFNYLDAHRKEISKFEDQDEFISKFNVGEDMVNALVKMAEEEKIKVNKSILKKIMPQLKTRIKAQMARNLYDDNAMFRVLLESDQDFKKALQVAHDFKVYAGIPVQK